MGIKKIVLSYLLLLFASVLAIVTIGDIYLKKYIKSSHNNFSENNLKQITNFIQCLSLEKDTQILKDYFSSLTQNKNLKYIALYKQTDTQLIRILSKGTTLSKNLTKLIAHNSSGKISSTNRNNVYVDIPEGKFFIVRIRKNPPYYLGAIVISPHYSLYKWLFLGSRAFLVIFTVIITVITTKVGIRNLIIVNLNKITDLINELEQNHSIKCDNLISIEEFHRVCKKFLALSHHIKKRYQKYYEDSIKDPLTGAFNLRKFYEDLEKTRKESMMHKMGFVLLIIDVDNFKSINDTLGHLEGDRVLREIVHILKKNVRETDSVYRYGGDEFTVILKNTDDEDAYRIAERIRKEVERNTITTVSIGGCYFFTAYTTVELMREADRKLYIAKKLGKNRTIILWEDTENTFYNQESGNI